MTNARPKDILPPRYGRIDDDSNIITPKHVAILANWVQKKHANAIIPKNHKFNMNRIYRGSRDGFDTNAIRKNNNTDRDLNDTPRGTDYWVDNRDYFIFSMGKSNDLRIVKISRVENSAYAMCESKNHNFLNFGYSDLVVYKKKGKCQQKYYESRILDISEFDIEEMEIFTFSIQNYFIIRMVDSIFKAAFSK
ncbi:15301_t:CDS:2 [Funneliformis mosseae]|uniref:15301_t:CDS:1 n=1 Tax=Funneliformis mosseae TaxID=27381 RepID=A0A9N9DNV4_FUNMO|nr:15301_t:CDS:2 [Funneliformis mosseae]